jgi:F0F1-type ATP synthase membrane subunit c/vacuolar-type H+-ATPase subunit K
MRYLLVAAAILVTLAGAWLVSDAVGRGGTALGQSVGQGAQPDATSEAVQRNERMDRTLRLTPNPPPEVLTRRENLIARTVSRGRAMGEANPRLVDVRLITVSEARSLLVGAGAEKERGNLGPDDKRVYVVRMLGSFRPTRLPLEARDQRPQPGIMNAVYDAETGMLISSGFGPADSPASP